MRDGLKNMIGLICIVTRKNQPEARGLDVSISAFVDANLAGNLKIEEVNLEF